MENNLSQRLAIGPYPDTAESILQRTLVFKIILALSCQLRVHFPCGILAPGLPIIKRTVVH
jgi:hypothetical protein